MTALLTGGRLCNPAIHELAGSPAWVCWRLVPRTGQKATKPPYTPSGGRASTTDPSTWSDFDSCYRAALVEGRFGGIGRILIKDEGLVAIDLDGCVDADGTVAPWANRIVQSIPSYWERSPSGAGLHSWVRAAWPTDGSKLGSVEVYSARRYVAVTGDHLDGTPSVITACPSGLSDLWQQFRNRRPIHGRKDDDAPPPLKATSIPGPLIDSLVRTYPQLRRIIERDYPSQSERDLAICRFAKMARWEAEFAWGVVLAVRNDSKATRPDYIARTLSMVGYA